MSDKIILKKLLEEDDMAPDATEHFDKKLIELTGHSITQFCSNGEKLHKPTSDYTSFRIDSFQITSYADSPYWVLEKVMSGPKGKTQELVEELVRLATSDTPYTIFVGCGNDINANLIIDRVCKTLPPGWQSNLGRHKIKVGKTMICFHTQQDRGILERQALGTKNKVIYLADHFHLEMRTPTKTD